MHININAFHTPADFHVHVRGPICISLILWHHTMTKESVVKTKTVGSNWNKLKTKVAANPNTKKKTVETTDQVDSTDPSNTAKLSAKVKSQYVGLDCEMVGIGPSGTQSALARCCLVDFDGEVIYDEFVRPPGFVTDFRTKWSGVRKKDLRQGTAISLQEVKLFSA